MQISEITKTKLDDSSFEIIVQTNPNELVYLGFFLEAFEGFCYYTTIDQRNILVKITTTKDYVNNVTEILEFLKNYKL